MPPFNTLFALTGFGLGLLLAFLVAYSIYRHQFLQIRIEKGISSILLILLILTAYFAGLRRLALFLEEGLSIPALLLESVFLVVVLLLFPPLSCWLEIRLAHLFSHEIRKFRELAEKINDTAPRMTDSHLFRQFLEDTLRRELGATRVRIQLNGSSVAYDAPEGALPLHAGDRALGWLEIDLSQGRYATAGKEALRLLATEISLGLERARLAETTRHLERELSQKSSLEQLGRMAATVAHNVKNPLSSMKTLLQLQSEAENLTTDQRREVQMMIREVDRLSKTINNLLKFSRLENQPDLSEASVSEVNLQLLADTVQSVFRGELEERRLNLSVDVEPASARILSNTDILIEVLGNLLANAIEASQPGHQLTIHIRQDEAATEFHVEDEGSGIPLQLRERLFEPFVTTKSRGTGLGLAIVKTRIEQLGGEVRVEHLSKGTRFILRLPRWGQTPFRTDLEAE